MTYDSLLLTATLSAFVVGVVCAGALSYWRARRGRKYHRDISHLSADAMAVLSAFPGSSILLGENDQVLRADASAVAYGLVKDNALDNESLKHLLHKGHQEGAIVGGEIEVSTAPAQMWQQEGVGVMGASTTPSILRITVAPLPADMTLILVEDVTRTRRLNATRRDFTANVSHELKTPVGAIALLAETLAECGDDKESRDYFVKRLGKETRRLSALVSDIIELSRLQDVDNHQYEDQVEVARVVSDALDSITTTASEKNIEIRYHQPTSLWRVRGDQRLLSMAVRNLLDNAVRYSQTGARVSVDVKGLPWTVSQLQSGEADLSRKAPSGDINNGKASSVVISVSDTGPGIAQSDQGRVFERFYRVDSARSRQTGGTGLGLSIVKHVMADHGGMVTVESRLGEGSTFSLILPVWQGEGEGAAVRPETLAQGRGIQMVTPAR